MQPEGREIQSQEGQKGCHLELLVEVGAWRAFDFWFLYYILADNFAEIKSDPLAFSLKTKFNNKHVMILLQHWEWDKF